MNLLIRADASIQMGTGHVMRCLSLAQSWQDRGGQVILVAADLTPTLEQRLSSEQVQVIKLPEVAGSLTDAEATATLAHQFNSQWIVVDGYQFNAAYQKTLKAAGLKLLFLDDYGHADRYSADLVLNQNVNATASLYANREPHTQLLLGTHYVLLRREFRQWIGWRRPIRPIVTRLLVTLGGSDPDNVTLKVIHALQKIEPTLETVVIVGGSNPHYPQLSAIAATSPATIQIVRNETDMPKQISWADLAITAGGSTCWEMALMGLPNLILLLAENQRLIAEHLDAMKIALSLGWHEQVMASTISAALSQFITHATKDQRIQMSSAGQKLVDGRGTDRVIETMIKSH